MWTQTRQRSVAERLGADRVVEVLGGGRVDRERRQLAQVARARRRSPGSPRRAPARSTPGGKRRAQPAVEHQRLDHVAGDVGLPEHALDFGAPRRAVPRAQQHEVARAGVAVAVDG